jgi:hypothetical protein
MDHMTDLVLRSDILADESDQPNLALRRDLANALDAIKQRTQRDTTDRPGSAGLQYQCQKRHLDLQFGFAKAFICRPSLRNPVQLESCASEILLRKEVTATCLQGLRECLCGFVQLNALCIYPCRSWSVIHNVLSSSLLLALTGELKRDASLCATLGELLHMFESGLTTNIPASGDRDSNVGSSLDPAYTRALIALRQMYLRDRDAARVDDTGPTARYVRDRPHPQATPGDPAPV